MSDIRIATKTSDPMFEGETGGTARPGQQDDSILAQAEDGAPGAAGSVRQAIADDVRGGRSWLRQCAATSRRNVQENPLSTVAWALAAGMVLGLLLRR